MEKMSVKDLKQNVLKQTAEGIRNRESFRAAIPLLVEIQDRAGKMASAVKEMQKLAALLGEEVSDYADANPKAFDSVREVKDESDVSLVNIDGVTYAYKRGWSGINRISGNNKTTSFVCGLPQEWVRCRWELNTSEIDRLGISDDVLAKHDLQWALKRTWSIEEE